MIRQPVLRGMGRHRLLPRFWGVRLFRQATTLRWTGRATLPAGPARGLLCRSGDRDYREGPPKCQGKNTSCCGTVILDTIILQISELRRRAESAPATEPRTIWAIRGVLRAAGTASRSARTPGLHDCFSHVHEHLHITDSSSDEHGGHNTAQEEDGNGAAPRMEMPVDSREVHGQPAPHPRRRLSARHPGPAPRAARDARSSRGHASARVPGGTPRRLGFPARGPDRDGLLPPRPRPAAAAADRGRAHRGNGRLLGAPPLPAAPPRRRHLARARLPVRTERRGRAPARGRARARGRHRRGDEHARQPARGASRCRRPHARRRGGDGRLQDLTRGPAGSRVPGRAAHPRRPGRRARRARLRHPADRDLPGSLALARREPRPAPRRRPRGVLRRPRPFARRRADGRADHQGVDPHACRRA